jgi:hypothetical protein
MKPDEIGMLLSGYTFNFANEKDLQEAIALIFTKEKIPFEREKELPGCGRIDFMLGDIGLEVKVGHAYADVVRQLHRYAKEECLSTLILVTTRLLHQMPAEINGKPLITVNLGYTNSL